MAAVKSAMAVAASVFCKKNLYYDLRFNGIVEIYENSPGPFEMISNAFSFGYAQGIKAEKAAQRKRARTEGVA